MRFASIRLLWQTKENGDLGDPVMGIANTDNDYTNIVDIKNIDGIHAIVPQSIGTTATSLRNAYQNPVSIAGNTRYSGSNYQWCTEYANVRWDVTKTVHDPCPAGWRIPQQSDLNMLRTYNTAVPSDAVKNGGILLKYSSFGFRNQAA